MPGYYDETVGAEKGLFRETLWGELVVAWCSHDKEAEGVVGAPWWHGLIGTKRQMAIGKIRTTTWQVRHQTQ